MSKKSVNGVGMKERANCGLMMEVAKQSSYHSLYVEFEDGTMVHLRHFNQFKNGAVAHPMLPKNSGMKGKLFAGFQINEFAFCNRQARCSFYDVTCVKCGEAGILTPIEMLRHHAEHQQSEEQIGHAYYVRHYKNERETFSVKAFDDIQSTMLYLQDVTNADAFDVEIANGDDRPIARIRPNKLMMFTSSDISMAGQVMELYRKIRSGK